MVPSSITTGNPYKTIVSTNPKKVFTPSQKLCYLKPIVCSFQNQNPNIVNRPARTKAHTFGPIVADPSGVSLKNENSVKGFEERRELGQLGRKQMLFFCGFGYWVQGLRCFPWLALNFHMAHKLNLHPSTLQLVQNSGNFPMAVKPIYGILSDAIFIGGAHRIPYIVIGVLLQIMSWGPLAMIPEASNALTSVMALILLGNLGASITEVAQDALVAEYGQKHKIGGLQSYAIMASAVGGILGNLVGGYLLLRTSPKTMFLMFSVLLSLQFAISTVTPEESLGLSPSSVHNRVRRTIWESIGKQLSDLKKALSEDSISRPLIWLVASIVMVPFLSGSIFCYQTQCLNLDPSIIGMSKVIGQLVLLSLTILYDRYWKKLPMRKLIGVVQLLYASSFLLDFVLVRQINLRLGIPNDIYVACFSGLAETLAQFKLLPFSVLFASLCPQGCEGSLTSFLGSAMCLSFIFGGFLGVGLASMIGITSGDYSSLPVGILIQFLAALLPLGWIRHVPMSTAIVEKERKKGTSKKTRKNRRIGRVTISSIYVYRRERESETEAN